MLSVQWERGAPKPEPSEDAGRRVQGGHSDPTADAALDSGRLYLRSVVERVDPYLTRLLVDLGACRVAFERALSHWQGGGPPDAEEGTSAT